MKVVFILSFLAVVSAHNWLLSPLSRNGNQPNAAGPCPVSVINVMPRLSFDVGDSFEMTWTTDHEDSTTKHTIYMVNARDEDVLEDGEDDLEMTALFLKEQFPREQGSGIVQVPIIPGDYIVQYRWGGSSRNCIDIKVFGNVPEGAKKAEIPEDCKPNDPCGENFYELKSGKGYYDAETGYYHCNEGCDLEKSGTVGKNKIPVYDCKCGTGAAVKGLIIFAIVMAVLVVLGVFGVVFYLFVFPLIQDKMGGSSSPPQAYGAGATTTTAAAVKMTPSKEARSKWVRGDKVSAFYEPEGSYYPATVVKASFGRVTLTYDGFPEQCQIDENMVRALDA